MDWELWGTFSVGDHLRRRAFVADVLLYDKLVIPTPPESDSQEQKRWREMGWRPNRQRRILDLIGRDRLVRVPWTEANRLRWETRNKDALAVEGADTPRAIVRSRMAEAASADVSTTLQARELFTQRGGET